MDDASVLDSLREVQIQDATISVDSVYLTLLALYILQESFADREDEWKLIAVKAKNWLVSAGVPRPKTYLKMFTLELVQ